MKKPANIEILDDDFDVKLLSHHEVARKYLWFYIQGPEEFERQLVVGAVLNILQHMDGQDAMSVLQTYSCDPEVTADLERSNSYNPNLLGRFPSRMRPKDKIAASKAGVGRMADRVEWRSPQRRAKKDKPSN